MIVELAQLLVWLLSACGIRWVVLDIWLNRDANYTVQLADRDPDHLRELEEFDKELRRQAPEYFARLEAQQAQRAGLVQISGSYAQLLAGLNLMDDMLDRRFIQQRGNLSDRGLANYQPSKEEASRNAQLAQQQLDAQAIDIQQWQQQRQLGVDQLAQQQSQQQRNQQQAQEALLRALLREYQ